MSLKLKKNSIFVRDASGFQFFFFFEQKVWNGWLSVKSPQSANVLCEQFLQWLFKYLSNYETIKFKNNKRSSRRYWLNIKDLKLKQNMYRDCPSKDLQISIWTYVVICTYIFMCLYISLHVLVIISMHTLEYMTFISLSTPLEYITCCIHFPTPLEYKCCSRHFATPP